MSNNIKTSNELDALGIGGPGTANCYDPIVGIPPPPGGAVLAMVEMIAPDASGTTEQVLAVSDAPPSSVSISSQVPSGSITNGKKKTKKFYIKVDSLDMFYKNVAGQWIPTSSNNEPFLVNSTIVGDPLKEVKSDEQYIIECPINPGYTGLYPAKLVIGFTLSDSDGSNSSRAEYTVTRES